MNENSYFKIYRSLLNDELFWLDETFTRGQAWVDLIGLANYGDVIRVEGDKVETYERGTVVTAERWLATRWKWSREKVRNFLKLLEHQKMCTTKKTGRGTLIVIENYELYQSGAPQKDHQKNRKKTTKRPQDNQGSTEKKKTIKEDYKKTEEERDTRKARGPYGRVTLSDGDLAKFLGDYPEDGQRYIEELDAVMERDGKSYRNCLPALYKWAKREAEYKARHPEEPEPEGGFTFSWAKFGKEEANT